MAASVTVRSTWYVPSGRRERKRRAGAGRHGRAAQRHRPAVRVGPDAAAHLRPQRQLRPSGLLPDAGSPVIAAVRSAATLTVAVAVACLAHAVRGGHRRRVRAGRGVGVAVGRGGSAVGLAVAEVPAVGEAGRLPGVGVAGAGRERDRRPRLAARSRPATPWVPGPPPPSRRPTPCRSPRVGDGQRRLIRPRAGGRERKRRGRAGRHGGACSASPSRRSCRRRPPWPSRSACDPRVTRLAWAGRRPDRRLQGEEEGGGTGVVMSVLIWLWESTLL